MSEPTGRAALVTEGTRGSGPATVLLTGRDQADAENAAAEHGGVDGGLLP